MKISTAAALIVSCCFWSFAQANPPEPNPASIVADAGLTHAVVRKVLPLPVSLLAQGAQIPLWFGDLYYCGAAAGASNSAVVLGVAYPGKPPQTLPAPILVASDCGDNFSGLKLRTTKSSNAGFVATKIAMTWKPWEITLSVTDSTTIGQDPKNLELARSLIGAKIASFNTAGVTLNLAGMAGPVSLNAALSFDRNSSLVRLFVSSVSSVSSDFIAPSPILQLPKSFNMELTLPYDFLNSVLDGNLTVNGIVVSSTDGIALLKPHISAVDSVMITGVLQQTAVDQHFLIAAIWKLSDLTLLSINVQPLISACTSGDFSCLLGNSVRRAIAPKLQARLEKTYLRTSFPTARFNEAIPLRVFDIPMQARALAVQSTASATALDFHEVVEIE